MGNLSGGGSISVRIAQHAADGAVVGLSGAVQG